MRYSALFLVALCVVISCNQPSSIGAGFLEDDEISLGFLDTLSISAATVSSDTILVYSPGLSLVRSYACGNLDDPTFGKTSAYIYSQMAIGPIEPSLEEATLDSIVLTIAYDSTGMYGIDTSLLYNIEVHRVLEDLGIDDESYSNKSYEVGDKLGGLNNFKINSRSPLMVAEPQVGSPIDTVTYPAHLRIPLTAEFGQELIDLDTTEMTTATNFRDYFEGIRIKLSDENNGIISFDMNSSITKVSLYYTKVEDTRRYDFDLTNLNKRTLYLEHDYEGTIVNEALNSEDFGDSIIFIQGLAGLDAQITVNNLESLPEDIIINKAELILTIKQDNEELFPPSRQLITFTSDEDGNLLLTSDVFPDFSDPRLISPVSGGFLINENNIMSYRLNMTSHIQRMIGGMVDNSFIISVQPSLEKASRVILHGPKSSIAPTKLEIVYTLEP